MFDDIEGKVIMLVSISLLLGLALLPIFQNC